jgi:hypothetical protein
VRVVVELVAMRDPLRGQEGQTTTEWLMVAGVLTMVALLLLNLYPNTIRSVLRAIGIALRTPAP